MSSNNKYTSVKWLDVFFAVHRRLLCFTASSHYYCVEGGSISVWHRLNHYYYLRSHRHKFFEDLEELRAQERARNEALRIEVMERRLRQIEELAEKRRGGGWSLQTFSLWTLVTSFIYCDGASECVWALNLPSLTEHLHTPVWRRQQCQDVKWRISGSTNKCWKNCVLRHWLKFKWYNNTAVILKKSCFLNERFPIDTSCTCMFCPAGSGASLCAYFKFTQSALKMWLNYYTNLTKNCIVRNLSMWPEGFKIKTSRIFILIYFIKTCHESNLK